MGRVCGYSLGCKDYFLFVPCFGAFWIYFSGDGVIETGTEVHTFWMGFLGVRGCSEDPKKPEC